GSCPATQHRQSSTPKKTVARASTFRVSRMGITTEEDPKEMKNHQNSVDEMEMKVVKFSRGKAANLAALRDKKLKGQLTGKEKLIGISAKAAAQAEKWFLPIEGGYLEPEDLEKTYRFTQRVVVGGVDISSARKPFDMILPGKYVFILCSLKLCHHPYMIQYQ
uniref:Uncharacterized protein n=1 Tax=Aegilops tauschii subsp. strangulata TaxID=200361 RepID=A0A453HD03_AEGTS